MMNEDKKYMDMALALAREGLGATYPNPMVGCVIVSWGEVIGQGYHHRAGQAHAEVNAIESVRDKTRLRESTLYVTLEPCSHFGKTPPCADRIVREGIPRVVVGVVDPFDQVAGRGIRKLEQAGIAVTLGVREQECRRLNERFFTFHQKKRPYVVLKWAQSADGYLDAQLAGASSRWRTTCSTEASPHARLYGGGASFSSRGGARSTRLLDRLPFLRCSTHSTGGVSSPSWWKVERKCSHPFSAAACGIGRMSSPPRNGFSGLACPRPDCRTMPAQKPKKRSGTIDWSSIAIFQGHDKAMTTL